MNSTEVNAALAHGLKRAAEAYTPWTSDRDAEQIRREVATRELVTDWYRHVEDMREDERAYKRDRILGAVNACLISILGVGAFVYLAIFAWGGM